MEIKKFDVLTIDNKEFAVASIINYEENTYYYISFLTSADIRFIFIKDNEFYQVEDEKLMSELFAQVAIQDK